MVYLKSSGEDWQLAAIPKNSWESSYDNWTSNFELLWEQHFESDKEPISLVTWIQTEI